MPWNLAGSGKARRGATASAGPLTCRSTHGILETGECAAPTTEDGGGFGQCTIYQNKFVCSFSPSAGYTVETAWSVLWRNLHSCEDHQRIDRYLASATAYSD